MVRSARGSPPLPGGGSSGTGRMRGCCSPGSHRASLGGGRGPERPDRRRRTRSLVAGGRRSRRSTSLPAPVRGGSRTTRSVRLGSVRTARSTLPAVNRAPGHVAAGVHDGRPAPLDPPGPHTGVDQGAGEQADPAVEVEGSLTGSGSQTVHDRLDQGGGGTGMALPETVRGQPPVPADGVLGDLDGPPLGSPVDQQGGRVGRHRQQLGVGCPGLPGDRRGVDVSDRAAAGRERLDLVAAVPPEPGAPVGVDLVAHPGPPVQSVLGAGRGDRLAPPRPSRGRPAGAAARPGRRP